MKNGTKLINKINNKEVVVVGKSFMNNGKRTWECVEFEDGTRLAVEEVERFYEEVKEVENKDIPKFKVNGIKNANAIGVKVYDFNKDTVEVGYRLINGKEVRKTVKKYTDKDGSWEFYLRIGYKNICIHDFQLTMTDEFIKEEFSNFKRYKAI